MYRMLIYTVTVGKLLIPTSEVVNLLKLSFHELEKLKFKRFSTSLVGMNSFLLSRCYTIIREFGYWAQSANALNLSPLSAPPLLRVDPQLAHFCWHTEADFDSR